jgi:hypothetical protein
MCVRYFEISRLHDTTFFKSKNFLPLIFAMLLDGMFSLSWFIYGGVLLFGDAGKACVCIFDSISLSSTKNYDK